jgi:7,8-dihydro-6-hydroxymethylpterin-pyrophosphokinase
LALLDRCREVERTMGRRRGERGAPRVIDLDLIFYGSVRMSHPRLRLPHPAWRERDFVLAPLLDLGIPPPSRIALPGFRRLLAELPAEKRCIESRVGRP